MARRSSFAPPQPIGERHFDPDKQCTASAVRQSVKLVVRKKTFSFLSPETEPDGSALGQVRAPSARRAAPQGPSGAVNKHAELDCVRACHVTGSGRTPLANHNRDTRRKKVPRLINWRSLIGAVFPRLFRGRRSNCAPSLFIGRRRFRAMTIARFRVLPTSAFVTLFCALFVLLTVSCRLGCGRGEGEIFTNAPIRRRVQGKMPSVYLSARCE